MTAALVLLTVQGLLGAWDTLYYHEWKLRLPYQPHARHELGLHAARDFIYTILFCSIGWLEWNGALAWALAAGLLAEVAITISDFIEEDRTRKLPPGERAMHAIMGILFGLFLAHLAPHLLEWSKHRTGFTPISYGCLSWVLTILGIGVCLSGVRDWLVSRSPLPGGALPTE